MTTLIRLRREAGRTAKWRLHAMGRFTLPHAGATVAYAECRHCGMMAIANARPAPNEIDIGGAAVAMNCPYAVDGGAVEDGTDGGAVR